MRRSLAIIGLAGIVAFAGAAALLVPGAARSQAQSVESTFMIAANDGYGVADCLVGGAACGKVIADAYCEAHGFRHAVNFGPASPADTTGSTATIAANEQAPISISCRK